MKKYYTRRNDFDGLWKFFNINSTVLGFECTKICNWCWDWIIWDGMIVNDTIDKFSYIPKHNLYILTREENEWMYWYLIIVKDRKRGHTFSVLKRLKITNSPDINPKSPLQYVRHRDQFFVNVTIFRLGPAIATWLLFRSHKSQGTSYLKQLKLLLRFQKNIVYDF